MSTPPPPDAAAVLAALRQAFPTPALPPPEPVAREGLWFDENGAPHTYENPEAEDTARFFAGRPWTDFAPPALLQWELTHNGLTFLTPRARAYYLPAYLTALLTEPLDVDTIAVLEATVSVLTRPDPGESRTVPGGRSEAQWQAIVQYWVRSFEAFVDALDGPQRSTVALFLKFFAAPELKSLPPPNPVQLALERFWEAYMSP